MRVVVKTENARSRSSPCLRVSVVKKSLETQARPNSRSPLLAESSRGTAECCPRAWSTSIGRRLSPVCPEVNKRSVNCAVSFWTRSGHKIFDFCVADFRCLLDAFVPQNGTPSGAGRRCSASAAALKTLQRALKVSWNWLYPSSNPAAECPKTAHLAPKIAGLRPNSV